MASSFFTRLKKFPFFQGLHDEVIAKLASLVVEETFEKGSIIFEEGDPGDAVYFVVSGQAGIFKLVSARRSEYKSLGIIAQEDLFGEMAFFDNQPRSARVMALTDIVALKIVGSTFRDFLAQDTASASIVLFKFITVLSRRLRESAREQVAVYETGKAIAACANVDELVEKVFDIVMQAVPAADAGLFALYNRYIEEIDVKASRGLRVSTPGGLDIPPDEPMVRILMSSRKPLDGASSPEDLFAGTFSRTKSLIANPLLSGESFLGFVALFSHGAKSAFSNAHRNLLLGICSQVAPALENVAFRKEESDRHRLKRHLYGG